MSLKNHIGMNIILASSPYLPIIYEVICIKEIHTEAEKTEFSLKCIWCSLAINLGVSNRTYLIALGKSNVILSGLNEMSEKAQPSPHI